LLVAVARHEADRVIDDQQPYLGALTSWAAWGRWRDAVVARYRALAAAAISRLGGRLDILVNNAGVFPPATTPGGQAGHPGQIAAAAVYLASDDASFVRGSVLDVDGGRTAVAVIMSKTEW
jgi:NAD(P)-dependent dehydrogenase (short-subunit alcohol dehydrogenase family)